MTQPHRCGWVALMGPPNAGKSTLTNALVGQKVAIVTPKPQTTRNRITGILTEPDMQIVFVDTPGVHAQRGHAHGPAAGQLGKIMVQSAWQGFAAAQAVLLVLDGDLYLRKPEFLDNDVSPFVQPLADEERTVIVAVNKIDMFHDKSRLLPLLSRLAELFPGREIVPVSALRRDGMDTLKKLLRDRLPEGEAQFPDDQLSTAPMRFMVAEIVREKLFHKLHQEVPYATAVDVEMWDEDPVREQVVIHAAIYVARPSHKAMVIGKAGEGIKAIGTESRKEIKELLGRKVHLELWVKVREGWQDDNQFLHEMGFGAASHDGNA